MALVKQILQKRKPPPDPNVVTITNRDITEGSNNKQNGGGSKCC